MDGLPARANAQASLLFEWKLFCPTSPPFYEYIDTQLVHRDNDVRESAVMFLSFGDQVRCEAYAKFIVIS
jgi:hypothetical protein